MITCCNKKYPNDVGSFSVLQYRGTKEDYDGVSEIICMTCNKRYGRWSEKLLRKDEIENKYGRK